MKYPLVLFTIALAGCSRPTESQPVKEEVLRREAFGRALLIDGGAEAIRVTSRDDVDFEEGFSLIEFDPPENYRSHAFRWIGQKNRVRVRNRDGVAMHLKIVGWVNQEVIHTRPYVTAYLEGQYLLTVPIDEKGFFFSDTTVDAWLFHGREWANLQIELAAVGFHWAEPPELKVATLNDFVWERR